MNIAKAAVDIYCARNPIRPGLSLNKKVDGLTLAYSAVNGERRLHRGQAAKALLEELLGQLGVADIPVEPFEDKGNTLFQDAYIRCLNNAGQPALDRFDESAKVDEEWALANDSPVHRGKAAMSRIAAAHYRIDIAVFSDPTPRSLNPDRNRLAEISDDLRAALEIQKDLLSDAKIDEKKRELVEGFRTNALVILAEAAGWMGDENTVNACLNEVGHIQYYKRRVIGHIAKGALAYMKGWYGQVISELEGKHEECVEFGAAEGAGKIGVLLLLSYLKTGRADAAKSMRVWLLSDDCPADGGNGLAKSWAACLAPFT